MSDSSSRKVLANDFRRQWDDIRGDALSAVERVGQSGWLILGEEVRAFERDFAEWWGVPHAIAVASGLDALEISLRCAGVEPGSSVITTPLTAFATTIAIIRVGARPIWCDVDESGGIDLNQVAETLRSDCSIQAILPVHLYGHPLDPVRLEALATEHGVVVIEDCAQSTGAERDSRPSGLAGIAAGTSLYPTKNLGALGDGGVVLTGEDAIAHKARTLRDYGQGARYEHIEMGLNSRLDELHAAILRSALLRRLDGWLDRRQRIASRYESALAGSSLRPITASGGLSAHHLFPVEVTGEEPKLIFEHLASRGIAVGRHYPVVCPDQPAAHGLGESVNPLPVARRLAARELSLPIHPYLKDDEVDFVIEACLETNT